MVRSAGTERLGAPGHAGNACIVESPSYILIIGPTNNFLFVINHLLKVSTLRFRASLNLRCRGHLFHTCPDKFNVGSLLLLKLACIQCCSNRINSYLAQRNRSTYDILWICPLHCLLHGLSDTSIDFIASCCISHHNHQPPSFFLQPKGWI